MGIVGIELVAWIIYCGAQTYRGKSQRHGAHGRNLENATKHSLCFLGRFASVGRLKTGLETDWPTVIRE
jgi:hypothetical protein